MQKVSWEIEINRPQEEVFAFHSDLLNIARVLPPYLKVQIDRLDYPVEMNSEAGLSVRIFGVLPVLKWSLRFEAWQPPHFFVDREIGGLFTHFTHRHAFTISETNPAHTLVQDTIEFETGLKIFDLLIWRLVFWFGLIAKLKSTKDYLETMK